MRYISICSGIEAATAAWRPLGWEAVAFAEIEPFPNAVLAHHYPGIPNLGDITKVDWRKYAGAVDLVVGGTPCQSFSVAGKREGLDGASGLVREYFRLLEEVRPRWFVWENVPGSLSSGRGNDFAFILRQWEKCGYHVAWRVLDAQFFGVPQRRRRVFAVGHLGGWQYPAAVLFESESLRGNPAPGRKARQENSGSVADSIRKTVAKPLLTKDRHNAGDETLIAKYLTSSNQRLDWETETLVLNDQGGKRIDISENVVGALRSQSKGHEPIIVHGSQDPIISKKAHCLGCNRGKENVVFCIAGNTIDRQVQNGGNGAGFQPEISYTLNTIDRHAIAECYALGNEQNVSTLEEPLGPLMKDSPSGGGRPLPAVMCAPVAPTIGASGPSYSRPGNERVETEALVFRETADCLTAAYGTKWNGNASAENGSLFAMNSLVRRLTPTECERLQGFPDGYTDIEFKGKPAPDGARYKALGNSMAVPCMRWIGERIQKVEELKHEMDK